VPVRLPSLLNPDRVVVWAAEVVRGLEVTLGNFDRLKQTRGGILQLAPYYKADLPSPDPAWQMLVVIDDGNHPSVCYSTGTQWLRVNGDTPI
jgi:predicted phosphoribosyltransferase